MAKKRRNQSSLWPFVILVVLPLLAIGLSGLAIVKGIQNYVTTSRYFKIRDVRMVGIADERYLNMIRQDVVGTNIFRLDAGKLSDRIRRRFPSFTSVTVTRVLPSELVIIAQERLPVVWIKRDAYYVMDADGVVVGRAPLSAIPSLPLLEGLDQKIRTLKVGASYHTAALEKPLLLAKTLMVHSTLLSQALKDTRLSVTRIDASDPRQLSFYLGESLEVKVGDKEFEARIAILPAILETVANDIGHISYIDLRPKEPVIATRETSRTR